MDDYEDYSDAVDAANRGTGQAPGFGPRSVQPSIKKLTPEQWKFSKCGDFMFTEGIETNDWFSGNGINRYITAGGKQADVLSLNTNRGGLGMFTTESMVEFIAPRSNDSNFWPIF